MVLGWGSASSLPSASPLVFRGVRPKWSAFCMTTPVGPGTLFLLKAFLYCSGNEARHGKTTSKQLIQRADQGDLHFQDMRWQTFLRRRQFASGVVSAASSWARCFISWRWRLRFARSTTDPRHHSWYFAAKPPGRNRGWKIFSSNGSMVLLHVSDGRRNQINLPLFRVPAPQRH